MLDRMQANGRYGMTPVMIERATKFLAQDKTETEPLLLEAQFLFCLPPRAAYAMERSAVMLKRMWRVRQSK